jgi:hypothetical protein
MKEKVGRAMIKGKYEEKKSTRYTVMNKKPECMND